MRFAINQAGIQEDNMGVLAIVPVFIGWLVWQKTGNIIFGALTGVIGVNDDDMFNIAWEDFTRLSPY